jgi:hypothetical protein
LSSKSIATIALTTGCYFITTTLLSSISFLGLNIRIANALRGIIPFLGIPSVIGLALGVFIGNIQSPIGFLDLFSVVPATMGMLTVYFLRKRFVIFGYLTTWLLLTSWLSFLLNTFIPLGFSTWFVTLLPQLFISDVVLPMLVYIALKKHGIKIA